MCSSKREREDRDWKESLEDALFIRLGLPPEQTLSQSGNSLIEKRDAANQDSLKEVDLDMAPLERNRLLVHVCTYTGRRSSG
jgi:hypothetical protein